MSAKVDDSQEDDVPLQAVRALNAAQARAEQSGQPQVLVVGRQLVRRVNGTQTVLKELPPRQQIFRRVLPAQP